MLKVTLKKKRSFYLTYAIALAIGLSLVAYVVYLLISNYTSQTELQKNLVTQLKQDSEIRAASVDYFFSERRDDVVNLALSREISGFFENKALGMSMEYGLNLSLIPIRELFIDLMERKQVGKDRIYSRIVLIERDGSTIVDVSGQDQTGSGAKKWKSFLNHKFRNGVITTSPDRKELLASVSYYHKDKYAGQIIAWIRPEIVDQHLLKEQAPGNRLMFLVAPEGDHFLSIGAAPFSLPLYLPELQSLAVGEIKSFETRNEGSVSKKRIALRISVKDTPFSLVRIVDARDAFGELNPDQLLINMAIQASVIFTGVFFIFGLTVRSLILQTRLVDSTIKERDMGEKNRQLEIEIVERKRAEEAFRESESRLKAITGSARDAILMMDPEGRVTYWNPAAEGVFNYTSDEAMGHNLHGLIAPSRYHAAHLAALPEFKQTGQGEAVGKTLELQAQRKDGREITVALSLSAVNIKGSWHAVGVIRDITEQKIAAEVLRQAKEDAEAATRAKSEFLANMSHEIRTPMNAILGMAELLAETPLSGEQEKYVQLFHDAGENLLNLINDILDLSKVEAGQIKLEAVPFHLGELVEKIVEILGMRARDKGLDLIFHIQADLPFEVIGDPFRLRQILTNLIGNAIKFTENGEIILEVKTSAPVDPATREMEVVFSITDTGIGISADQVENIFEKFTQADASTARKFGGTGLGLTITKHFVELMGGTISVQSELGGGSVFSFTVAIARQDQPRPREEIFAPPDLQHRPLEYQSKGEGKLPPVATPEPLSKQPLRILLVEDSEDNRTLIRMYMKNTPHDMEVAENGQIAVDKFINDGPFDLVFMDIQMPVMDGYEATRAIRAWEAAQNRERSPIVALTAHAFKEDLRKSLEAGCDAHLTKPLKKVAFLEAIDRYAAGILPRIRY